jgi:hypothetical protein
VIVLACMVHATPSAVNRLNYIRGNCGCSQDAECGSMPVVRSNSIPEELWAEFRKAPGDVPNRTVTADSVRTEICIGLHGSPIAAAADRQLGATEQSLDNFVPNSRYQEEAFIRATGTESLRVQTSALGC